MNRRHIWDFWAPRYDRLWVQRVSLGPTRAALRAQLSALPPGRLLDMGCGTGQLLDEIQGLPGTTRWDYTGVDAAPAMVAEARRKHPDARFECADVMTCAAPPAAFDVVVCAHAFPYMPDKSAAFARLASWLRPGGRMLLAQACPEAFYDRVVMAFVKCTTSPARYLPVADLRALARPSLGEPTDVVRINRHVGVPSLRLLVWDKPAGGDAA